METELWGWESLFEQLTSVLRAAERQLGVCNKQYAQYVLERFERCTQTVAYLQSHMEDSVSSLSPENRRVAVIYIALTDDLLTCLRLLGAKSQHYLDCLEAIVSSTTYRVDVAVPSRRGRPRFLVTQDQLEHLRSLSFTWTDVCSLLGVSRMTIYRHRQEFGMVDDPHGTLNDDQLRTVMTQHRREQPYYGETMVMGQLRAMGYCVSRERVRESIRSTDPINTALRWGGQITARRSYSVPSPNSLWHIGMSQTYASSSLSLWHRCVTQLYCCW